MRNRLIAAALLALAVPGGCALLGVRPVAPNPLPVPSADFDTVWKAAVAVLDEYFDIASENRLSRTIKTQPLQGATIFEPWHGDSVDFEERVESTLQSIRRYAEVHVDPAPGGGFLVRVEVYKQLENLIKPDRQTGGRAVFNDQFPINRSREIIGPVPLPVGWVPRGRDTKLEQVILDRLRDALFL